DEIDHRDRGLADVGRDARQRVETLLRRRVQDAVSMQGGEPLVLAGRRRRAAHARSPAGHSQAAPRTPDASPWAAGIKRVVTTSENTHSPHSRGTLRYSRSSCERPPPSTITCGSSTLMMPA